MKIVIFTHPSFSESESMPKFARLIVDGMRSKNHEIMVWKSTPLFYKLSPVIGLKKWLGYLDQYLIFPALTYINLKKISFDTLIVFSDQALGPLVSLVKNRPHVIHVHDFMALRSSLGEFPQNPTRWSGRIYQAYIKNGFKKGKNFISVSKKTQLDLHRFIEDKFTSSEVVYNGLNFPYRKMSIEEAAGFLALAGLELPSCGILLHVGGNLWYKNRVGVVQAYKAYSEKVKSPLPLWMIGPEPTSELKSMVSHEAFRGEIKFLTGLSDSQVCAAYSIAALLIFPSIAEGFGWPVAEAMACGCLVLTTNERPMTEVGGDAAFYIPPPPVTISEGWIELVSEKIKEITDLYSEGRFKSRIERGYIQSAKFKTNNAIDGYESNYLKILRFSNHINRK